MAGRQRAVAAAGAEAREGKPRGWEGGRWSRGGAGEGNLWGVGSLLGLCSSPR